MLYDLILYNSGTDAKSEDYGILIEHDRSITQELTKILKRYKIRRKVIHVLNVGQSFDFYVNCNKYK